MMGFMIPGNQEACCGGSKRSGWDFTEKYLPKEKMGPKPVTAFFAEIKSLEHEELGQVIRLIRLTK